MKENLCERQDKRILNHRIVMGPSGSCRQSTQSLLLVCLLIAVALVLGGCVRDYVRPAPQEGYYYLVKKGDTLYRIAMDHKVGLQALADLNGVQDAALIHEGMVLFIPGSAPEGVTDRRENGRDGEDKKVTAAGTYKPGTDSGKDRVESAKTGQSVPMAGASSSAATAGKKQEIQEKARPAAKKDSQQPGKKGTVPPVERREEVHQKGKFMWPAKGKVISTYGPQPNGMFYNGIRIEIKKETAVSAASGGQVIFSAFLKDYGETVIIKHGNDYATVYTHLTRRLVKVDQFVKRGESIALIVPSLSGASFFDFEIRYRNKAKDPLLFL